MHSLSDSACACSYKNLPKYHSYRVSNTVLRRTLPIILLSLVKMYTGNLCCRNKLILCLYQQKYGPADLYPSNVDLYRSNIDL